MRWVTGTAAAALALGTVPALVGGAVAEDGAEGAAKIRVGRGAAFFDGSLADAIEQAKERNVPLVIFAALEGEEESDRFREHVLESHELDAAAQRAVLLIVNNGKHAEADGRSGNDPNVVMPKCSVYEVPTCKTHFRNFDPVYHKFVRAAAEMGMPTQQGGQWKLPQALVIGADGRLAEQIVEGDPPRMNTILAAMERARKQAGPGIGPDAWRKVRKDAARARERSAAKDWANAWRAWNGVLGVIEKGPIGEEANKGRDAALEGLRGLLREAVSYLEPRFVDHGYGLLHELIRSAEGTPIEDEVQAAHKRAAADPAIAERVRELRVELNAEDLLEQALDLLADGKKRKAKRLAAKLLRPPYKKTPAAQRLREEHPDLVR